LVSCISPIDFSTWDHSFVSPISPEEAFGRILAEWLSRVR
jgi:hypothetical protein